MTQLDSPDSPEHPRKIKSFVLRTSRMTAGQREAFDKLWSEFGLDPKTPLDTQAIFGRQAPTYLEIGIGMGDALIAMAKANPDINFIGAEVHTPGIGKVLKEVEANELTNIRLYHHDVIPVLAQCITDESLDKVMVFFPDPWHKTRHHKRRLVNPPFLQAITPKLAPGGLLHFATDWEDYARHMKKVMAEQTAYQPFEGKLERPNTKFEARGERLGHRIEDLGYVKSS